MNISSWKEFWVTYTEFMRHGETAKSDDRLHYIWINARHYITMSMPLQRQDKHKSVQMSKVP